MLLEDRQNHAAFRAFDRLREEGVVFLPRTAAEIDVEGNPFRPRRHQPVEQRAVISPRPGPFVQLIETCRIDLHQDEIACGRAFRQSESMICQQIVERREDAESMQSGNQDKNQKIWNVPFQVSVPILWRILRVLAIHLVN